jgi:hypothetical protein
MTAFIETSNQICRAKAAQNAAAAESNHVISIASAAQSGKRKSGRRALARAYGHALVLPDAARREPDGGVAAVRRELLLAGLRARRDAHGRRLGDAAALREGRLRQQGDQANENSCCMHHRVSNGYRPSWPFAAECHRGWSVEASEKGRPKGRPVKDLSLRKIKCERADARTAP